MGFIARLGLTKGEVILLLELCSEGRRQSLFYIYMVGDRTCSLIYKALCYIQRSFAKAMGIFCYCSADNVECLPANLEFSLPGFDLYIMSLSQWVLHQGENHRRIFLYSVVDKGNVLKLF